MESTISMAERTASRRDALREVLRKVGVEAMLVTNETNVTYLTGFTGDSTALYIGAGGRDLVVSDGRYELQLEQECPGLEVSIRPIEQPLPRAIAAIAAGLGMRRLGFESSSVSVADAAILEEALTTTCLLPQEGHVEALRSIKDESEIASIRRAVSIAERAFMMVLAGLRVTDSEADVADHMEAALRRCGAQAASFPPIAAAGKRSALPHARPSTGIRVGDEDFFLLDWGAADRPLPYRSDLTRVIPTGNVGPKFEQIHGIVTRAQRTAIAAIRPGVTAELVDQAARSVIEEAGFGPYFSHGLGHGLGLDIHEAPRLRRGIEDRLEAGMVVTVEPGIYLPDWGGIRIEDDILVTTEGSEMLSTIPTWVEGSDT